MFYRDRNGHRIAHGCNTVCNPLWFGHEASAESTLLYAITRTADINIDFIVAKVLCNAGTSRQGDWVIAAELKRDGMLDWVIGEMSSLVAMQNRAGCHHLSVEQSVARDLAHQIAKVPICTLHHGRNAHRM